MTLPIGILTGLCIIRMITRMSILMITRMIILMITLMITLMIILMIMLMSLPRGERIRMPTSMHTGMIPFIPIRIPMMWCPPYHLKKK
jgi:hypothetical protein